MIHAADQFRLVSLPRRLVEMMASYRLIRTEQQTVPDVEMWLRCWVEEPGRIPTTWLAAEPRFKTARRLLFLRWAIGRGIVSDREPRPAAIEAGAALALMENQP